MLDGHGSEVLVAKVRAALQRGKCVFVYGWKDSNHSSFTRKLPHDKVQFCERVPRDVPSSAGLVLFTKFVSHKHTERAKRTIKDGSVHSHVMDIGAIKALLQSCPELASEPPVQAPEPAPAIVQSKPSAPPAPTLPPELAKEPIDLMLDYRPHTPESGFAQEFIDLAGHEDGATLSKYAVSELIKKHFGSTRSTKDMVATGFLRPIVAEGARKTGQYAAGVKLMEVLSTPSPTDPIERARWLISHKQNLLDQQAALNKRLDEIGKLLQRIASAEQLLEQLDELLR